MEEEEGEGEEVCRKMLIAEEEEEMKEGERRRLPRAQNLSHYYKLHLIFLPRSHEFCFLSETCIVILVAFFLE